MKPREYCCCAIPLINAGIFAILTEQLVLGVIVGTLSISTPPIVGAATPSMAPWILAIICYVAAALQVIGFISVTRERTILYSRYVTLHIMATIGAFAVSLTWIIVSATRHSVATNRCINDFFPASADGTTEGSVLCDIFPWVDVGLMGGLWIFFAGVQTYLFFVLSSYGTSQRTAHEKFNAGDSPTQPLTNSIPLTNRKDTWDARPSEEAPITRDGYGHLRQASSVSVSTVLAEKVQQPVDTYSSDPYPGFHPPRPLMDNAGYGSGPPSQRSSRSPSIERGQTHSRKLSHPPNVYTQEPTQGALSRDVYRSDIYDSGAAPAPPRSQQPERPFRQTTSRIPPSSMLDFEQSLYTNRRS